MTDSNDIFFSNKETSLILSEFIENWKQTNLNATLHSEEAENLAKNQISKLNIKFDQQYAINIIEKAGYPLWDASVSYPIGDNGFIYLAPILKESSTSVEGLFSFIQLNNSGNLPFESYNLLLKKEIISNDNNPNSNLDFLKKFYSTYNEVLFSSNTPTPPENNFSRISFSNPFGQQTAYDPYACIGSVCGIFPSNPIPSNDPDCTYIECFNYCSCTQNIFSNGLAPTPEERSWLHGNCNYASTIDDFLENNDDSVDEIVGAAEFSLD